MWGMCFSASKKGLSTVSLPAFTYVFPSKIRTFECSSMSTGSGWNMEKLIVGISEC